MAAGAPGPGRRWAPRGAGREGRCPGARDRVLVGCEDPEETEASEAGGERTRRGGCRLRPAGEPSPRPGFCSWLRTGQAFPRGALCSLTCGPLRHPARPKCGDASLVCVCVCSSPNGKGCALCDRPPPSSGKRGDSVGFPWCAPAGHPPLHGELRTPHIRCRRTHVIPAGRKLRPLCPRGGSCCKRRTAVAAGEPPLLAQGFPRQVAGQVAGGRPGLGRAARQVPLAPACSSCCSALVLPGQLGSAAHFGRGSRSLR